MIPNLKLKKTGQQSSSKALFSFFFAFFIPLFFSETVNQSSLAWLLCVAKDDLGLLIFLPYLRNARITTEHNYVWLPGFCFVLFCLFCFLKELYFFGFRENRGPLLPNLYFIPMALNLESWCYHLNEDLLALPIILRS